MADRLLTGLDWEDVRFFVALARHGSLSATARALAVTHVTVARRVAGLERALGAKLMERRPSGFVLTAAGERALTAASAMERAAQGLRGGPGGDPAGGLVRITATPSLAEAFLIARLAGLRRRHPGLDIEMIADTRALSLARHEADLAVRIGRPADSELIGRRLVTLGFGFYARPDWRRRLDAGAEPEFVGFDEPGAHIPEAVWLARRFPRCRITLRASGHTAQAVAARAGHGIALLPGFLGRSVPGLVPVLTDVPVPSRELWLLSRPDSKDVMPVRVVRDFVIALFGREKALFATT